MIRLLIFCLREDESAIFKKIDRYAAFGWRQSGDIVVHAFDASHQTARNRRQTTDEASQIVLQDSRERTTHVLVIRGPQILLAQLPQDPFFTPKEMTKNAFLDQSKVESLIAATGWGWMERTKAIVESWIHGKVDVQGWIKQFSDIGETWVAEYLLRNLCFVTGANLSDAIARKVSLTDHKPLRFGLFSEEIGKSGGVVGNLLKKQFKNASLAEVAQCIEQRQDDDVILVEDGLYSATEIIAVLDSLLGQRPVGRRSKTQAIANKDRLKQPFSIIFGVTVDYGIKVVQHYLAQQGEKIAAHLIADNTSNTHFCVLPESNPAVSEMTLKQFRHHLSEKVMPWIFSPAVVWHGRESLAKQICTDIGTALWDDYINQQVDAGKWQKDAWPQERIRLCALGMDGLGLTVILAHSIPKATLPIFWAGGNIKYGKKKLTWKPLFPNA